MTYPIVTPVAGFAHQTNSSTYGASGYRAKSPMLPMRDRLIRQHDEAIDAIRAERTRSGSEEARHRLLEGTASDEFDSLSPDDFGQLLMLTAN